MLRVLIQVLPFFPQEIRVGKFKCDPKTYIMAEFSAGIEAAGFLLGLLSCWFCSGNCSAGTPG
jgi:hypothetical protein